eukprot:scaffold3662_cov388-Prasinococcus_capsulatus_cf.AAC.9
MRKHSATLDSLRLMDVSMPYATQPLGRWHCIACESHHRRRLGRPLEFLRSTATGISVTAAARALV